MDVQGLCLQPCSNDKEWIAQHIRHGPCKDGRSTMNDGWIGVWIMSGDVMFGLLVEWKKNPPKEWYGDHRSAQTPKQTLGTFFVEDILNDRHGCGWECRYWIFCRRTSS